MSYEQVFSSLMSIFFYFGKDLKPTQNLLPVAHGSSVDEK